MSSSSSSTTQSGKEPPSPPPIQLRLVNPRQRAIAPVQSPIWYFNNLKNLEKDVENKRIEMETCLKIQAERETINTRCASAFQTLKEQYEQAVAAIIQKQKETLESLEKENPLITDEFIEALKIETSLIETTRNDYRNRKGGKYEKDLTLSLENIRLLKKQLSEQKSCILPYRYSVVDFSSL
jgi:hypothetical protein